MTWRVRICTEEKRRESADNWESASVICTTAPNCRRCVVEVPKDVGITFGVYMSRGEKRISSIPFSFGGQHTELSTRCQSPIPRFPSPLPPFPAPATDKWEDEEEEDEEEEEEEEDGGCFVPIRPWCKVTGKGREGKGGEIFL